MKALKWIYACMLIGMCMAFVSCNDDEDVSSSELVGTWSVTEDYYRFKEDGKVVEEGTDHYQTGEWTFTLNEDGTLVMNDEGYTQTGSWSVDGNKLYMTLGGGEDGDTVTIKDFSKGKIVIEYKDSYTEDGISYEDYEKLTLKKS